MELKNFPLGKYEVIVIDPPWPIKKSKRSVRPNQIEWDYSTMTTAEIGLIPIKELAADNSHLFLWTTQKYLPIAINYLSTWDFRYVCTFVWHKSGGPQPFDLPQFNCEFVIYARKGKPKFIDLKAFRTCFNADRREHSRKPEYFMDLLDRVTEGSKLELFARSTRTGWVSWGNEINKF